ncbi:MAG: hypothetical protein ABIL76_07345 [candidate division WOR-3 bacterium]
MKISRINYNQKVKFVRLDGRYLRILSGSNLEDLKDSEFLLLYDFEKMLAPIKPSKIITIDSKFKFKFLRANNCVISPSADVLTIKEELYLKPQVGLVIGKDRIFGFLMILSFFTDCFNDIRDYALDTYSPFSEFISNEIENKFKLQINENTYEIEIKNFEKEKIFLEVKKFFHKLFISDVIAYEFEDIAFKVKVNDFIKLESSCGKIQTLIKLFNFNIT